MVMEVHSKTTTSTTTLVTRSGVEEVPYFQRILWLCNLLYYQVLAVVSIILLWSFLDETNASTTFTMHLVLSTAAYVPLMAAAIILFSEDNLTTLHITRTRRYWIHGILLSISCVAVTIGISVEVNDKSKSGRSHFVSQHAILGLASWILVFVSTLIGVLAANTRTFSSFIKPVILKLFHNVIGLAAFALGVASLWKMLHHVKSYLSSDSAYKGFEIGLIYITVWSGLAALKSLYRQIKSVFS